MRYCTVLNRSLDESSLKYIVAVKDPTTLRTLLNCKANTGKTVKLKFWSPT